MNNKIYIPIVLAIVIVGGFLLKQKMMATTSVSQPTTQVQPTKKPGPPDLSGQKFSDTPLFSKATLIFPGALTQQAKTVLNGFVLKTNPQTDGSVEVTLIANEAEDTTQKFNVAKGDQLYFVEMNPVDDATPGQDGRLGDDIGVLVDSTGIVK